MDVKFIFTPFKIIINTILLPVILGGALFYLVEPLQRKLEEKKVPRWGSILIILLGIAVVLAIIIIAIAPKINEQITSLIDNFPSYTAKLNDWRVLIMDQIAHMPDQVKQLIDNGIKTIESSAGDIGGGIFNFLQSVTSAMLAIVLVPFFFIFM